MMFQRYGPYVNVARADPAIFVAQPSTGNKGQKLQFVGSDETPLCCSLGTVTECFLRTPFEKVPNMAFHGIFWAPYEQEERLESSVIGKVWGLSGSLGGPLISIPTNRDSVAYFAGTWNKKTPLDAPEPNWIVAPVRSTCFCFSLT